jgi:HAD superfamily phosphoserine phosphatase-like hydrolase
MIYSSSFILPLIFSQIINSIQVKTVLKIRIIVAHNKKNSLGKANIIEQKGDRVYTFTRERIKWHKEQGHIVIAISGSPLELVKEMSEKYHMDDYRGTIYKLDENGKYNGEVVPMWDSDSKQKAINELVEKHDIDLSKSYAYGDTSGDYTMFKSVGCPFAINPTKELLGKIKNDESLKDKINLIVERKDVTYKLDMNSIEII